MITYFLWRGIGLTSFALFIFVRDDGRLLYHGKKRALGTVVGYRRSIDEGSDVFMALVRFETDASATQEIVDAMITPTPTPAVSTRLPVIYPASKPQWARVHRPALRALIYAFLVGLLLLLVARLLNVIE